MLWQNIPPLSEIHFRTIQNRNKPSILVNYYNRKSLKRKSDLPIVDVDSVLTFDASGRYGVTGLKSLLALRYFYENTDSDYMMRANSTSYFDLFELEKYINSLPRTRVYAGVSIQLGNVEFKSGACNILSRDVVGNILKHSSEWNHEYPEDVAVGQIIQRHKLAEFFEFGRATFLNTDEISATGTIFGKEIFHYRCKTGESEKTIQIMNKLHKKWRDYYQIDEN